MLYKEHDGRFGRESLCPKVEYSIVTMSIPESNSLKPHTRTHTHSLYAAHTHTHNTDSLTHFMQHTHNAASRAHTSEASGHDNSIDIAVNLQEK